MVLYSRKKILNKRIQIISNLFEYIFLFLSVRMIINNTENKIAMITYFSSFCKTKVI